MNRIALNSADDLWLASGRLYHPFTTLPRQSLDDLPMLGVEPTQLFPAGHVEVGKVEPRLPRCSPPGRRTVYPSRTRAKKCPAFTMACGTSPASRSRPSRIVE